MSGTLDLDDVAATSEQAKQELAELREQVGEAMNPRYLLWRVWHGDNPSMRLWDYTQWVEARWGEFAKTHDRRRPYSRQDHADFDAWLRHWTRSDIATTVRQSEVF